MDNISSSNPKKEERNAYNWQFGSLSYFDSNLFSPELQNQDNTNVDSTAQNEQGFDLKRSAHPVAAAFHLLFKIAGILVYSKGLDFC